MVARYLYDAWGNCTIGTGTTNQAVAKANPIRYRGYYYDDDTGLIWSDGEKINNDDTVVVEWSATLGDNYTDRSYFAKDVLHGNLTSDADVVNFVIDLINGSASTDSYDYISEDMENDDRGDN